MTDATPAARRARFDALFDRHQRQVLAYALRRTRTEVDAEDVAAETFTTAWRKLDTIPLEAELPWLYAVARRVLANHHRGRSRRERLAALLRVDDDVPTPLRLGEGTDGPAMRALATLSTADQEILRLVAWEELSNIDIADVLGITPNAVAIRLYRARARFAAAMAALEDPRPPLKDSRPSRTSGEVKGTHGAAWEGASE